MGCLLDAPSHHRLVLLPTSRGEINEVRDIAQHRDVVETDVGNVVHAIEGSAEDIDDRRIAIDAEILCYLVVGTLDESAIYIIYRTDAALRHTRNHSNCLLLGDAYIHMLCTSFLTAILEETSHGRSAGGNCHQVLVLLHLFEEVLGGHVAIVLATTFNLRLACLDVERHTPVPRFLVLFGRCIALAFLCMDMNHDRMVDVLYFLECLDQCLHVIAIGYILVVQAHGTEEVAFSLAVGFTQEGEVLVKTTMVLGDAHLIVVHDDDDACAQFAYLIKAFECLATAQRTITNQYHDVLLGSLDVTSLLKTAGKGDGCGGMA